ncbi:MAG: Rab family GTPase [Candidatus Thorarchaeota archaeon]
MEDLEQQKIELTYKICVFGDAGVGKTSLVDRYLTENFHENIQATLGASIHIKFIAVRNGKVTLQIWDFGGHQNFRFLIPSYALGSSGAVFMFDITNTKSLTNLNEWLSEFRKVSRATPILLVGGKSDLLEQRDCEVQQALRFMQSNNFFNYIECSSKTGENIESIFRSILSEILIKQGRNSVEIL